MLTFKNKKFTRSTPSCSKSSISTGPSSIEDFAIFFNKKTKQDWLTEMYACMFISMHVYYYSRKLQKLPLWLRIMWLNVILNRKSQDTMVLGVSRRLLTRRSRARICPTMFFLSIKSSAKSREFSPLVPRSSLKKTNLVRNEGSRRPWIKGVRGNGEAPHTH